MPVIRQQRTEFLRPAQVNRMDTGAADYAQAISRNADQLAGIAFQRAAQKAEEVGTERALGTAQSAILTINPETGRPEAFDSFTGMGEIANQAFKRIVDNRFRTEIDADLRQKSAELASQNPNPEAYASAFSSYAGGLVENADPMYREFVMTTSTEYLEKTKLNLVERARAAARAENRRALLDRIESNTSAISEAGMTGDIEDVLAKRAETESEIADGLASDLIDETQAKQATQILDIAEAEGILTYATENISEHEAVELATYIRSNGNQGTLPSGEHFARVGKLLSVENRGDILSAFASNWQAESQRRQFYIDEFRAEQERVFSNYQSYIQARSDRSLRSFEVESENFGNAQIAEFAEMQRRLADLIDDPYTETRFAPAVQDELNRFSQRIAREANVQLSQSQELFTSGRIGTEERNRIENNIRAGGIRSVLTGAFAQSPQDALHFEAALTEPTPDSLLKLTPTGQAAVAAIRSFYDPDSDMDSIRQYVSMGENEYQDAIDRTRLEVSILNEFEEIRIAARNGDLSPEMIAGVSDLVNSDETARLISALQISDFQSDLRYLSATAAVGPMTANLSSETIKMMQEIEANERSSSDLGLELGAAYQEILDTIPTDNRSDLKTSLRNALQRREAEEAEALAEQDRLSKLNAVLTGQAPKSSESAVILQEHLTNAYGFNPNDPSTWNNEDIHAQVAESGLLPEGISNGLELILGGAVNTPFADNILSFYETQANFRQPYLRADGTTGVKTSRASESLSMTQRGLLDDALRVARQSDAAPSEIIRQYIEVMTDTDLVERRIKGVLGKESDVQSFLQSIDVEGYGIRLDDRPDLIEEVTNFVTYKLATLQGTRRSIISAVENELQNRFVQSDFVFDTGYSPAVGRAGTLSEFSPSRFARNMPSMEGADNFVYDFFAEEVRRYDPSTSNSMVPIDTATNRSDGGYFISVLPESTFPDRVLYGLFKEEDGVIVPAIFEAQDGPFENQSGYYSPVFDSSKDFKMLVEENRRRTGLQTQEQRQEIIQRRESLSPNVTELPATGLQQRQQWWSK